MFIQSIMQKDHFFFGQEEFGFDDKEIIFSFDSSGKPKELKNLKITPKNDNFDYISNDISAQIVNYGLNLLLSGFKGKEINIRFDDRVNSYANISREKFEELKRALPEKSSSKNFLAFALRYGVLTYERDQKLFNELMRTEYSSVWPQQKDKKS